MTILTISGLEIGHSPQDHLGLSIDLSMNGGYLYYLSGKNGSGKTTFLRTLTGYIKPLSGKVILNQSDNHYDIQQNSVYFGYDNGIKKSLTVDRFLNFSYSLYEQYHPGGQIKEIEALFQINKLRHLPIGFLSTGQKRRVALCSILALDRLIYCFDEASVGLDKEFRTIFYNYISELVVHKNRIVIFSDHHNPQLMHQINIEIEDFLIQEYHEQTII